MMLEIKHSCGDTHSTDAETVSLRECVCWRMEMFCSSARERRYLSHLTHSSAAVSTNQRSDRVFNIRRKKCTFHSKLSIRQQSATHTHTRPIYI